MNRRAFAKLSAAALGLPALAAADHLPLASGSQDVRDEADAHGSPLSADEMADYQKSLPDRQKSLARLDAVQIPYSVEPDFVFRAAMPAEIVPARRKRGGRQ